MDENLSRPERIAGTNIDRDINTGRIATDYDRDVDIRRSMIMGRDLATPTYTQPFATVPTHRAIHWGPIFAGLTTSLVSTMLLGSLFLGLGFDRSYGLFGGLTGGQVGIGAGISMILGVFVGAYLGGYVSDVRTKAEAVLNGFMTGVMSILTPIVLALFGAMSAAQTATLSAAQTLPKSSNVSGVAQSVGNNIAANVPSNVSAQVQNGVAIAADNAWQVFAIGMLILGVASLAGYLGRLSRERSLGLQATELDRATTY